MGRLQFSVCNTQCSAPASTDAIMSTFDQSRRLGGIYEWKPKLSLQIQAGPLAASEQLFKISISSPHREKPMPICTNNKLRKYHYAYMEHVGADGKTKPERVYLKLQFPALASRNKKKEHRVTVN